MTRRGGMQQVELLDTVTDDDRAEPLPARRRGPRARWFIGAAAVVVLVAAAAQWVSTSRQDSALERLAQVPGVLAPVDASLTVTARGAPGDDIAAILPGGPDGTVTRAEDGSQTYTWVDPADATAGWTTPLVGPTAALANLEGTLVDGTDCRSDTDETPAARAVCLVTDGGFLLDATGDYTALPATSHEIVVLATRDGSVLARWPIDAGDTLEVLPHDRVAVGSGDAAGTAVAVYDLSTGAQRWTYTEEFPPGATYVADPSTAGNVFTIDGLVAIAPPSHGIELFTAADGRFVRELPADAHLSGPVPVGGTGAVSLEQTSAIGHVRTTYLAPGGDPADDVTVDGQRVQTTVDDGSVPGLALTFDATTKAWDSVTGQQRWSADVVAPTDALVVRGRVYLMSRVGIAALDGETGKRLWGTTLDGRSPSSMMTDGRRLLVAFDSTSASGTLVAYDLVSGRVDFRAAYPAGIGRLTQMDRRLVGTELTTGEDVVLG